MEGVVPDLETPSNESMQGRAKRRRESEPLIASTVLSDSESVDGSLAECLHRAIDTIDKEAVFEVLHCSEGSPLGEDVGRTADHAHIWHLQNNARSSVMS
jgi:hypothetical protein